MSTGTKVFIFLGAIIFLIIALSVGTSIWLNSIWFNQLGYLSVYIKMLWTRIGLWFTFFSLFLLFSIINMVIAYKKGNIQTITIQQQYGAPIEISRIVSIIITLIVLSIMALVMANNGSSKWDMVLKYLNKAEFNLKDPLFQRDISFYVFTLPIYVFLKSWSLGTLVLTIIVVGLLYLISGHVKFEANNVSVSDQAKKHIITLFLLLTIIIAWNYWLKEYQLLFSRRAVIYGAGYTDTKVVRYTYYIMIPVALYTAVMSYRGLKKRSFIQPLIGYGALIVLAIVITGIVPGIFQQISVKPNELIMEEPYIKYNINFTRGAFNLDHIEREPFEVADSLTSADFTPERGISKNIRLWDQKTLKTTYSQLQEFRLYYNFNDVDVDRYRFGDDYRQVMLSAREINYNEIPPEAKTWVNEKLQFTHGYGVVMSPINEIGEQGLPVLIIKDIPPKVTIPIEINRPEIYFGEETTTYVIVNTKLAEFDYPKGDTNVNTRYAGPGGIPMKGFLRRLLLTIKLKSLEIIFTRYLTPESKLMIFRSIQERVPKLAPFLRYDPDPYLVIYDGRLYWMMDAYTTTDRYPYSNPHRGGFNYIRNAVKITVDAYTGDVNFYIIDKEDPIIKTYSKIFPDMFKNISEMPEGLLNHIRYPLFLFTIQADTYTTYHMTDTRVFYNKEDKWTIPKEIYGETEVEMTGYYVIVKLSTQKEGADSEQFALILPFTPVNKNNMVAWIAAINEPDNYGKIIEYQFPKEKLIYGPLQIESRIDQDTTISELFTLWGQRGSAIIRGNLLVNPIKDSLIYVEPIYLRAEQSELPEIKRVIVGYQDKIEIGLTLEEALGRIFGTEKPVARKEEEVKVAVTTVLLNVRELVQKALDHYNEAQRRIREGDFTGYGEQIRQLQNVLTQLEEKTR